MSKLGLTTVVGESKTIDGNTVTIDEVFYDGTRFTVSYSLESEEPLGEHYIDGLGLTFDGERVASSVGHNGAIEVTSTYLTWISSIGTYGPDLPDEFELGLSIDGKNGEQWKFVVPVVKQIDVDLLTINHKQQVEGLDLTVSDIKIGSGGSSHV